LRIAINWKTCLVVYVAFLIIHLLLSFSVNVPLIYADEAAYINNARNILFDQAEKSSYYSSGYSWSIIPAFLINNDIRVAYKIIQMLNSLYMSAIPVIALYLAKIFEHELKEKTVLIIAIIVSLYPPFLLYSNMAMSEAILIPLYLIIVLIFALLHQNQNLKKRLMLVFLLVIFSMYIVFVHPRSAVIFPAFFLVSLVNLFSWIKRKRSTILLIFSIVLSVIISIFAFYLLIQFGIKGTGYSSSISKQLGIILSISGIKQFLLILNGQVLYLLLATFGLALMAVISVLVYLFRFSNHVENPRKYNVVLFVVLCFLFEIGLSSLFMITPFRADHFIYGRYTEGFLLPILLLGILIFVNDEKIDILSRLTLAIMAFVCFTGSYLLAEKIENLPVAWLNIFGVYAYKLFNSEFNLVSLSVFYLLLTIIVYSNRKSSVFTSIFIIGFLFSVSTLYANHDWYRNDSLHKENRASLVKSLSKYKEINDGMIVVNLDKELDDSWDHYNYMVYVPEIQMNILDLHVDKPIGDLILTKKDNINELYPGARIVGIENFAKIKMWLLPGKNLLHFESMGYVAAEDFPGPLPEDAFRSNISLIDRPTINIKNEIRIPVKIQHVGSDSFWPNLQSLNSAPYSVRIGVILYKLGGKERLFETRTDLPHVVYPNDIIDQEIVVDLDQIKNKIDAGEYLIRISLVQEQVAWFFDKGDNALDIKISFNGKRFILE